VSFLRRKGHEALPQGEEAGPVWHGTARGSSLSIEGCPRDLLERLRAAAKKRLRWLDELLFTFDLLGLPRGQTGSRF